MSGAVTRGRAGGRSGGRRHAARGQAPGAALLALTGHVLRMQSRGVVIWGVALGLYSAAIVASYTTFSADAEGLNRLLEAYPQGMLDAFGITDLGDVRNYMSAQVFVLAPLALAFFPILVAAGAIEGAEERGTMDVLLSNPIRRPYLVVGYSAATALSLLAIVAIVGALTYGTAALVDVDLPLESVASGVLNLWPLCMFFGGLAMLCSALFRRRALAIAVPAAVLVASYLLDTLGRVSEDLEGLRPYSVFYYYGSAIEDGIDRANFLGLSGAALLLVVLAALAFGRRDIYT